MTSITIQLSDEQLAKLQRWSEQTGLSADEFLRRQVEQLLAGPDDPFQNTAEYVLQKNTELYRRLA